jgi:hypothetical protein
MDFANSCQQVAVTRNALPIELFIAKVLQRVYREQSMKKLIIALAVIGALVWLLRKVWKNKADRTELSEVRSETDTKLARAKAEMNAALQAAKAELQASVNELKSNALPAPVAKTA